jgi:hypothetical protein
MEANKLWTENKTKVLDHAEAVPGEPTFDTCMADGSLLQRAAF